MAYNFEDDVYMGGEDYEPGDTDEDDGTIGSTEDNVESEDNEAGDTDEEHGTTEDDVDTSPHTMLVFPKEILSQEYKMTSPFVKSSASDQGYFPLTRLPVEILVLVIKAMPPLTRCAFALTCKCFATISCHNKCLEVVYAERYEVGHLGYIFDHLEEDQNYSDDSETSQWYFHHISFERRKIERMAGICTRGITEAICQWSSSSVAESERLWLARLWKSSSRHVCHYRRCKRWFGM